MEILIYLFFTAPLSLPVGFYAKSKGLGFWRVFFVSFLLTPFVGIIAAAVSRPTEPERIAEVADRSGRKKCPSCAEWIQKEAKIFRYCQRDVSSSPH